MSELSPLQLTRAKKGRGTGGAEETFLGTKWKSIITHWSLGAALSLSCAWIRSQCQADCLTNKLALSNDPFVMTSKLGLPGHPGGLRKEGIKPRMLLTHKELSPAGCNSTLWGARNFGHHLPGFLLNPEDQEKQRRWKITSIHNPVKSLLITTDQILTMWSESSIHTLECEFTAQHMQLLVKTMLTPAAPPLILNHFASTILSWQPGSYGYSQNCCEQSTGRRRVFADPAFITRLKDGPSWANYRHAMRLLSPFPYTAQLHLILRDDSTAQTLPQRYCPCGTPGRPTDHLSSGLHPVQEAVTEASIPSATRNMDTPAAHHSLLSLCASTAWGAAPRFDSEAHWSSLLHSWASAWALLEPLNSSFPQHCIL